MKTLVKSVVVLLVGINLVNKVHAQSPYPIQMLPSFNGSNPYGPMQIQAFNPVYMNAPKKTCPHPDLTIWSITPYGSMATVWVQNIGNTRTKAVNLEVKTYLPVGAAGSTMIASIRNAPVPGLRPGESVLITVNTGVAIGFGTRIDGFVDSFRDQFEIDEKNNRYIRIVDGY